MKFCIRILAVLICVMSVFGLVSCSGDKTDNRYDGIYYIEYKGVIALGADASPVLKALGDAKSSEFVASCGDLGSQMKYVYDDIILYTLENGGKQEVDKIVFTSDLISTPKEISIGSSGEDIISKYGAPSRQDEKTIEYTETKEDWIYGLKFELGDDKDTVKGIQYIRQKSAE